MRRLSLIGCSLLLGLWATDALAAEYSVELPAQRARVDAEGMLLAAGVPEARVARRYERELGWSYVVLVDGLADLDAARVVGGRLAAADQPATIFEHDGKEVREVEMITAATPAGRPEEQGSERGRRAHRDAAAASVLSDAVKAHGGRAGGLERLAEAGSLKFVFERTIPKDGTQLVARHTFVRQGDNLRLDVKIIKGEGKDSETAVGSVGAAWVAVDGVVTERDAARTREVLDRFSPETLFAVPLGLPDDVETAEAWRDLRFVGTVKEDGAEVALLEPAEAGRGGLVSASFDPSTHTLRRVTWAAESGQLTFRYDDYHRLDRRLVVPFHARVERDGVLVEEVRVDALDLDVTVPSDLFASPRPAG